MMHNLLRMTCPEILSLQNIKLILPIVSIADSNAYLNLETEEDEYVLPPVYQECITSQIIADIITTVSSQLPSLMKHSVLSVRVVDLSDNRQNNLLFKRVIFGVNPLEQHGAHLSVATDIALTDCFIRQALADIWQDDLYYAPSLYYGCLRWGMAMGACISIPEATLHHMVEKYIQYFETNGGREVILVSTHLAKNHMDVLKSFEIGNDATKVFSVFPLNFLSETADDCHAGIVETSLSVYHDLHVDYDMLLSDAYQKACYSKKYMEEFIYNDVHTVSQRIKEEGWNGVVGRLDMAGAQPDLSGHLYEKGKIYNTIIVNELKKNLKEK